MKKIRSLLLLALFCAILLCGCAEQDPDPLVGRVFRFRESDDIIKPGVAFQEDKTFTITFGGLSSYIGIGTYRIDGDTVTLNTDDGFYTYVFTFRNDVLIFDGENSDTIPTYGFTPVTDGTIFS